MKKRIISMLVIMTMALSSVPVIASAAESGTCGDNAAWTLENGTLTISGTGPVYSDIQWRNYSNVINTVIIEDGITEISSYSFYEFDNLTSITIPDSVVRIGDEVFYEFNPIEFDIHYNGTIEQWNLIDIGMQGGNISNTSLYCDDGKRYELNIMAISIPDGLDYTDDGITIGVGYARRRGSVGGGAYDYIGYDGITEYTPVNTYISYLSNAKYVTFYPGDTYKSIIVVDNYPMSGMYDMCYAVQDDAYMGSERLGHQVYHIEVNCIPKTTIQGTISIPGISEDAAYAIYAEENRTVTEWGITSDYAATYNGTVSSETGADEYSLNVKPNTDYTVTVAFDDKKYVRQIKSAEVGTEPLRLDFDSFTESQKITEKIKLPENMSGITDIIYGSVFLQGSEPPHFNIDECEFRFSAEAGESEFELYNDYGSDNVIVYYLLYSDIEGLYVGGNYSDDTLCVPNVKDAVILDGTSRNIEINMINGQRIHVSLECAEDAQDTAFYALTGENDEMALYGFDVYSSEQNFRFSIPDDFGTYKVIAKTEIYDEYGNTTAERIMYYDGEKFADNMTAAKVYTTAEDKNIEIYWNGYTEISYSNAWVDNDKLEIVVSVSSLNVPDGATLFAVGYGDTGISGVAAVNNGEAVLDAENVTNVKVFCWDSFESMIPLCDAKTVEIDNLYFTEVGR